jgi:hypothetical protein
MRPVVFFALLMLSFLEESRGAIYLPNATVFKGESEFDRLVQKAESEDWRSLPLGERTVAVGEALLGIPYAN